MPAVRRRHFLGLLGAAALAGAAPRPAGAAAGALRIGLKSLPALLNPLSVSDLVARQVLGSMYESLTSVDPQGRILPGLATAWEASEDARRWRLTLREGATFHTGRPFAARDVKRSFEAALATEGANFAVLALAKVRGFREVRAKTARELSGVAVIDDRTLDVVCDEPCAVFPFARFNIVDVDAVEKAGPDWFRTMSAGTGPYRLLRSNEGIRIDVEANPAWRGGAVPFERVSFLATGIGNDGITLFNDSQVDFTFVDTDALRGVMDDPGFKRSLSNVPRMQMRVLALDPRRVKAFADLRVRRAMSLLIDRQAMAERFFRGVATVHNGVVPPALLSNERLEPLAYDPMLAKQLLEEAGYPEGRGIDPFTVAVVPEYRREFVYYVSQWNNAGIPAKLATSPRQEFIARSRRRDYDAFLFGWTATYPDPMNFLDELFTSRSRFNPVGWTNAEFDGLIERAMAIPDPDRRAEVYKDAEHIVMTDMPVIPLVVPDYVALRGNVLSDNFITPFGGLNFA
ncbi:peptide ABC transporter substrate-binding protein [Azospirillum thiophilum]|uniref:Peptide ABC transporter substrate-binding protein n=1 Tax=Azospirillum thiophilum TaxID=528244 RepID=A0AAC8W277_9PROT|nr:ABC transporter substrate-binding protein [Azospirillum thiophilum]ALG73606.1 peptide ABC transporter substrate-binding protein [Azospirillum thiophilum]KJR62996.1 peptide ABC transporter substrate-binding protein [Azospirillum thiophilum]